MTTNRRRKDKIRTQQAITGQNYLEASRQIAGTPPPVGDRVAIQPPLADWLRPRSCNLWRQTQREHGQLIALRISAGPGWWELDDLARSVAGALQSRPLDKQGLWLIWDRHAVTRRDYLPGIVDRLDKAGALDRLEVRETPDAQACTHATCRRRRGLPLLPREPRSAATSASAREPLPLRPPVVAFTTVMEQHQSLNRFGFGVHHDRRVDAKTRAADLQRLREELVEAETTVRRVHDWLVVTIAAIKTPTTGSYGMKHLAEKALGDYIANGELIAAALMAGYPMRYHGGLNAQFGMSRRDVDRARRAIADA